MNNPIQFAPLAAAIVLILLLLIWCIKLQLELWCIQKDLLERDKWHYRQLAKYRERL